MSNQPLIRIALAQINPVVGDVNGNAEKIISWSRQAKQDFNADVVVFPELALTGYPPEDLLFRHQFIQQVELAIETIDQSNPGLCIIFGAVSKQDQLLYNNAVITQPGCSIEYYAKHYLPN